MNISHTRNDSVTDVSYHIKSNPVLTVKKTIKDLGDTTEDNLKFSSHINNIITRALARANLIHNNYVTVTLCSQQTSDSVEATFHLFSGPHNQTLRFHADV